MDGTLSQDEINALLNGMDSSDNAASDGDAQGGSDSSSGIDESILTDVDGDLILKRLQEEVNRK